MLEIRRRKNVLAGTFNVLLKEEWGGGSSECEKCHNPGKVLAYCEILYPRNNVES